MELNSPLAYAQIVSSLLQLRGGEPREYCSGETVLYESEAGNKLLRVCRDDEKGSGAEYLWIIQTPGQKQWLYLGEYIRGFKFDKEFVINLAKEPSLEMALQCGETKLCIKSSSGTKEGTLIRIDRVAADGKLSPIMSIFPGVEDRLMRYLAIDLCRTAGWIANERQKAVPKTLAASSAPATVKSAAMPPLSKDAQEFVPGRTSSAASSSHYVPPPKKRAAQASYASAAK